MTTPPADRLAELAGEVLTAPQLAAFELHEAGLGCHRIGLALGVSRSTVRERLAGAERRLRAALEQEARA